MCVFEYYWRLSRYRVEFQPKKEEKKKEKDLDENMLYIGDGVKYSIDYSICRWYRL